MIFTSGKNGNKGGKNTDQNGDRGIHECAQQQQPAPPTIVALLYLFRSQCKEKGLGHNNKRESG
ncbi:alpha-mannosidase [Sesbania bispinosa]|nr:alpha-mannosidase [Sesbania bispinosa]